MDDKIEAPSSPADKAALELVKKLQNGSALSPAYKDQLLVLLKGDVSTRREVASPPQAIGAETTMATKELMVKAALEAFVESTLGRPGEIFRNHGVDKTDEETAKIVIKLITQATESGDLHTLARMIAFLHDFSEPLSGDGYNAPYNWRRSPLHKDMWRALVLRLEREKNRGNDFEFIWHHVVSWVDFDNVFKLRNIRSFKDISPERREDYIRGILEYLKR